MSDFGFVTWSSANRVSVAKSTFNRGFPKLWYQYKKVTVVFYVSFSVGLLLSNYVNSSDVMSYLFEKVYIIIGPRTLHKFLLVSSTSNIELKHVVSSHRAVIFVLGFIWKQEYITFFGKGEKKKSTD